MNKDFNKEFYKHPNFSLFFFYLFLLTRYGMWSWQLWALLLMLVLLGLNLWVAVRAKDSVPSRYWCLLPLFLGLLLVLVYQS